MGTQNGGCDFFLWAPDAVTTVPNENRAANVIECNCNQAATLRTVSKDGPNKGRQFYSCAKPMGQSCNFFKWADEVTKQQTTTFVFLFMCVVLGGRGGGWWWR